MKKWLVFGIIYLLLQVRFGVNPGLVAAGDKYQYNRVQIITQSFPHQYERHGGYRHYRASGISGDGAAILVGTILGLGVLSVWNRSLNDTATVAVVQERERTERERIRAEATKYAIGRDGNSSYRSSEGYAELRGSSGGQCNDAELRAAKVPYGTNGFLQRSNESRCYYDLR